MKILIVHNLYTQQGGECRVFHQESELLRSRGHDVIHYVRSNKEIEKYSFIRKIRLLLHDARWNEEAYNAIKNIVKKERPDIAHIHNTFYVISPSIYYALKEENIPVVQTIHNFRFFAPCAILFRNGKKCEKCLRKQMWISVFYGCWRESRLLTFMLNRILAYHQRKRTFLDYIDVYIALTDFVKRKLIECGFPDEKIIIKPNFISEKESAVDEGKKTIALFIGRLTEGKGILALLEAWKTLKEIPLVIAGDGPLKKHVGEFIRNHKLTNVNYVGWKNKEDIAGIMERARFLVIPSLWYENFPMAIVESFSKRLSVVGSRIGSMNEIIENDKTGLLFQPGDIEDMRSKIIWAWQHAEEMKKMGENAYLCYRENYDEESNYEKLMEIYQIARTRHAKIPESKNN